MAMFLLGIAVLVGGLLLMRGFVGAEPKALLRAGKWLAVALIIVVTVFLAATGRLGWVLPVAAGLLPFIVRAVAQRRAAAGFGFGGTAGPQTSRVETSILRMTLDHESGALDGEVLRGPAAGRRLGQLTRTELLELLALCRREDKQAAQLLTAYLDRCHDGWRDGEQPGDQPGEQPGEGDAGVDAGAMTRDEAYRILGLEAGASEQQIRAAYRRLIVAFHPDRGGSPFLAALINRARDVLLGR